MHDLLEKEGKTVDLQNESFVCNSCKTHLARTLRKQTTTVDTENRDEDMKVDSNADDTLKIENVLFARMGHGRCIIWRKDVQKDMVVKLIPSK